MGPTIEGRGGSVGPSASYGGGGEVVERIVGATPALRPRRAGGSLPPRSSQAPVSPAAGKRARCSRSHHLPNLSCACCQNALPAGTWSIALLIKSLARTSTRFQRRGFPAQLLNHSRPRALAAAAAAVIVRNHPIPPTPFTDSISSRPAAGIYRLFINFAFQVPTCCCCCRCCGC